MSRLWTAALAPLLLAALPELGQACAVCFDPAGESRRAFLATTAFLSLLPLGMVVGTGLWLRRRARRMERDGESASGD